MEETTIAYFDASHDLPEEIVMGAGFKPYKILGDVKKSTEPADQYLFQTFCPAARSFLTEALDNPNKWAGIVIAHGCDATNRQFDIWKMHVKTPFIHWVNKPMKTDKTAKKFFKGELKYFIDALEKQYNVKITDEKLKKAIKTSNEIKKLLQEISKLRSTKDIPNKEYFELARKAVQEDKDSVIADLKNALEKYKSGPDFPSNKKKILLTGSDITYVEWMEMLDEVGLRVVRDDLSIGDRYYATLIPDKDDPLDALIEYHVNIPMPATKHIPDLRLKYLLKIINESEIDGVVSQNVKFCEPYAYDSVFVKKALDEKKISNIHIERDFTPSDEQIKNRLEAFRELL